MGSNWAAGSGRPQRRRMHHGKRERSLKVWLLVATAAVTLLVVGLLGHGLLQQYWFTPRRAVVTVGLSEISLRTLQQQTRYRRVQLLNEFITYSELRDRVASLAGALKMRGVEKGDRVIIYMPMIPEALEAMLACARLGAVHSVVFGGFAAHELAVRIDDCTPKAIIASSCGLEPGRVVHYKPLLDEAIEMYGTLGMPRHLDMAKGMLGAL